MTFCPPHGVVQLTPLEIGVVIPGTFAALPLPSTHVPLRQVRLIIPKLPHDTLAKSVQLTCRVMPLTYGTPEYKHDALGVVTLLEPGTVVRLVCVEVLLELPVTPTLPEVAVRNENEVALFDTVNAPLSTDATTFAPATSCATMLYEPAGSEHISPTHAGAAICERQPRISPEHVEPAGAGKAHQYVPTLR